MVQRSITSSTALTCFIVDGIEESLLPQDADDADQDEKIVREEGTVKGKGYSEEDGNASPSQGTERKRAKRTGESETDFVAKLLMIHQLWLWKIDASESIYPGTILS